MWPTSLVFESGENASEGKEEIFPYFPLCTIPTESVQGAFSNFYYNLPEKNESSNNRNDVGDLSGEDSTLGRINGSDFSESDRENASPERKEEIMTVESSAEKVITVSEFGQIDSCVLTFIIIAKGDEYFNYFSQRFDQAQTFKDLCLKFGEDKRETKFVSNVLHKTPPIQVLSRFRALVEHKWKPRWAQYPLPSRIREIC